RGTRIRRPASVRECDQRLPLARCPEAARARDRARERAVAAAAGRADRRHVGHGDARDDPARRAHRARARSHAALHRARHGRRVLDRAEDRRAAPGPRDRRRSADRCPRRRRGAPRLSRREAMSALLEAHELQTAYGLSRVLFGVSLEVAAGECVCLLGRNGVGKTTTMRSIMGLTPPQAGRVTWKGADITGWAPYRVARAGIGFVPEDRRIFADLTVWENLDVASKRSHTAPRSGHPRREPDAP